MSYTSEQQTRIDAYLMKLRRSLGDLRPEDVNEILREIRGHILERAEAIGEVTKAGRRSALEFSVGVARGWAKRDSERSLEQCRKDFLA